MKPGWLYNKMKKNIILILLVAVTPGFFYEGMATANNRFAQSLPCQQLIIVVAKNWNTVGARLYAFEKQKGNWGLQFSFPVVVGQNGMAMGEGMRTIKLPDAPQKKEGDLKSPAGIFYLGPAFGYAAEQEAKWIRLPYVCATDTLICIDDPNSMMYNKMVKTDTVKMDWNSHEEMHRQDEDYKWGIFVHHNDYPVKKSLGSCIFLHIWEGANEGTAGCTAMEEKNILTLLKWIRADKSPLLVQFPEAVYRKIYKEYQLPDL
jgi:L,D-peptidoglycan transpeptidase YkuD (ErfK/YbiS/YcfS/YnhG family)